MKSQTVVLVLAIVVVGLAITSISLLGVVGKVKEDRAGLELRIAELEWMKHGDAKPESTGGGNAVVTTKLEEMQRALEARIAAVEQNLAKVKCAHGRGSGNGFTAAGNQKGKPSSRE